VVSRLGPGIAVSALPPSEQKKELVGKREREGEEAGVGEVHVGYVNYVDKEVIRGGASGAEQARDDGDGENNESEEEEEKVDIFDETTAVDGVPVPPVYYDADALLREIVDRKCRIQSIHRVDVNQLVEARNCMIRRPFPPITDLLILYN
jgi:hypothetical protein